MNWKIFSKTGACVRNEALLEDYLVGTLPSEARWRMDAHIARCGDCRDVLEQARLGTRLVQNLCVPAADPGEVFTQRVLARVRAEAGHNEFERLRWQPLEQLTMRLAVSSALALGLMLSFAAWPGLRHESAPITAQSFAQDHLLPDSASARAANSDALMAAIAEDRGK